MISAPLPRGALARRGTTPREVFAVIEHRLRPGEIAIPRGALLDRSLPAEVEPTERERIRGILEEARTAMMESRGSEVTRVVRELVAGVRDVHGLVTHAGTNLQGMMLAYEILRGTEELGHTKGS